MVLHNGACVLGPDINLTTRTYILFNATTPPPCAPSLYLSIYLALSLSLSLSSVVCIPYRIGFGVDAKNGWHVFELMLDFSFALDIIVNFMSAYKDPAQVRNET